MHIHQMPSFDQGGPGRELALSRAAAHRFAVEEALRPEAGPAPRASGSGSGRRTLRWLAVAERSAS